MDKCNGCCKLQETITSLSDLEQVSVIGVGNFGSVFVVRSKHTGNQFALKVLGKEQVVRRNQLKHTLDELKTLKTIRNHPFMVNLYAWFKDNHSLYLCLELGTGELFSLLREVGRFETPTTIIYSAEIVCAFEYLHAHNIAYRDLKPENVLIGGDGHLRLCDFGFSKAIRPSDRTWTVCGTPEYMAPEIILGKGHDKSVDYWSLGIFIFELLAGYPPFLGSDTIAIYENVIDGNYFFPTFFPFVVKDLVGALLNPTRSKRLGNLVGGISDIKTHPFFLSINWEDLLAGKIPAPEVPTSPSGSGYFDLIKPTTYKVVEDQEDLYPEHFKDWDYDC